MKTAYLYHTELNDKNINILVEDKSYHYSTPANNPEKMVKMINEYFALNKKAEEYVYMLAFNSKLDILGIFEVSHGSVNYTIINPRDILIKALLCGATSFIIFHNHPSKNISPSTEDSNCQKRLTEAANIIGIPMLDFIVIGGDNYYSYK